MNMTRQLIGSSLILATAIAVFPNTVSAQTTDSGWQGNLTKAAQLAAKSGKPLFVVFRCVR